MEIYSKQAFGHSEPASAAEVHGSVSRISIRVRDPRYTKSLLSTVYYPLSAVRCIMHIRIKLQELAKDPIY